MGRLRNGVGVGISNIPTLTSRRPVAAFSPLSLFADGSQGVWYDDSNMATMFQDSAGTIAAALESPVGLQLDLSKSLALGAELVTNGTFATDTAWTKETGWSISGGKALFTGIGNKGLIQNIGLTANAVGSVTIVVDSVTTGGLTIQFGYNTATTTITTAGTYTYTLSAGAYPSIYIVSVGVSQFVVASVSAKLIAGNHRFQTTNANRPTLSARYNLLTATATLSTQSITTAATSYTIYFTGSGSVVLSGTYIGTFTAGTNTFTATAGTLTATVVGSVLTADIRPTNQTTTLPAYQYVTSSSVYDTVGFPQYINYNTPNGWLATSSINFTATAQMGVFSGMRKLSTTESIFVMLGVSLTDNGSFYLDALSTQYDFFSRGTAPVEVLSAASYPSPETATIALLTSISAPSLVGKRNGTQIVSSTATQGTGNYSNYPLYFGSRAGVQYFFNGQEFQTIIVGKTLTATEITNTETYVNSKTKAY